MFWRSSHLRLGLPSGFFPLRFPTKTIHAFLFYPVLVTCTALFIVLHFIAILILGEQYWWWWWWCSSFRSFLNSPLTSSLLDPSIFLNTLFPNTLNTYSSLICHTEVHTHTKQQAKLWFCFSLFFLIAYRMTKHSRPNGSRHSPNLMCPSFPHACHSDMSVPFPHTLMLSHIFDWCHIFKVFIK